MSLVRWEPFRGIDTMQREMNRLFDQWMTVSSGNSLATAFTPAAELEETDEAFLLKLEVPGMQAEDLDIQVGKDTVSISGERKSETKTEENGFARTEFRYGKFQRVIPLPSPIQNTAVKAAYHDGILSLTLPKTEDVKQKLVKVSVDAA